jgi:hypothetical protein
MSGTATDRFWQVVETARAGAEETGEPLDRALVRHLVRVPRPEILAYAACFDALHDSLYRHDVWAAAYLIGGGCSDDSFIDFRAGVIGLGRVWFERVAADPDVLAAHPLVLRAAAARGTARCDVLFHEEVNYAASDAFEQLTGDADAFDEAWRRSGGDAADGWTPADMGEDFDFDDDREMRRRLPRLAALFLGAGP